jgi:UDP-2,3-diacylglucosamine pyrophosphatase LpxH
MLKRELDIAVISDVHLGTYGCHAREIEHYLRSIAPRRLIINGDFIDGWQFSKKYFPESHTRVLQRVLKMMSEGVKVIYLTGNHDEMLRRYSGFQIGNFELQDKLVLEADGKKFWFFHGDVFDLSMQHGKWLAKLGGFGYDLLILLNRYVNRLLVKFGYEKYSFSKKVKGGVKAALRHINNFEQTVAEIAGENGYDCVICGHIHEPVIKEMRTGAGSVTYLNSGDWIENLTALEYANGEWTIYHYAETEIEIPAFESEFPANAFQPENEQKITLFEI